MQKNRTAIVWLGIAVAVGVAAFAMSKKGMIRVGLPAYMRKFMAERPEIFSRLRRRTGEQDQGV